MAARRYATMYERLVANTRLAVPDNPQSCWLWTGTLNSSKRYPQVNQRRDGKHHTRRAHRVMLEEICNATFPLDEGGHLCFVTICIHPDHLEVQTAHHNLNERRGYAQAGEDGQMIPVLFPREDSLQRAADWAFAMPGEVGGPCPF